MLKYQKMARGDAHRAWPKIIPSAVPCETQLRDIHKAGVPGFSSIEAEGKATVRCLYSPADNRVLLEEGVHVATPIEKINGFAQKKSPFPGYCLLKPLNGVAA